MYERTHIGIVPAVQSDRCIIIYLYKILIELNSPGAFEVHDYLVFA